ncbi:hypothetical protein JCM10908_006354 [Rhodotorula pacifica]|uniref:uncharacterized protein n=1 Tax=Rhodotorula pacifica TaxID=1495444 RepID=UPI00316E10B6
MLGKRTRGNGAEDDLQAKRPLVTGLSTKPALAAITSAKRIATTQCPPTMQRTLSQKENQAIESRSVPQVEHDVFMADAEAKPASSAYTPREAVATVVPADPPMPKSRSISHIYAHAASLLSTSSDLASSLPLSGRTDQRETLLAFLQRRFPSAYASRDGGPSTPSSRLGPPSMYVSGPPGIGKTALLSSVLGDFGRNVDERDLRGEICVLMENCATIAAGGLGGEKAWERLAAGLQMPLDDSEGGRTLSAKQRFEEGLQDGRKYLLVLDEIDHLVQSTSTSRAPSASQQPDLLNALFQLASVPASPLTLIGIANDLTLKALSLSPLVTPPSFSSDKGKAKADPLRTPTKPIRLHFKPYNWQELVHIVDQRLSLLSSSYPVDLDALPLPSTEGLDTKPVKKTSFPLIDKPALERCAKKIATGTGDVRTMLDVVRRAVGAVGHEQAAALSTAADLAGLAPSTAPKATMKHVSAALAASTGLSVAPTLSARLSALQGGPHQRLVLVAIIIALSRVDPNSAGFATLACASPSSSSSTLAAPRVVVDECYKVYRDFVKADDVLKPSALDSSTFVETVGMVEDLGGFVIVRGRPGSSPSSSPSKSSSGGGAARRLTPTKVKKHERGRVTVELSPSAPMADLVAVLTVAPLAGREADEDEIARISRRLLERERSAQMWDIKRREMGRDEDRRAEEELEGREWERSLTAAEVDGPAAAGKKSA